MFDIFNQRTLNPIKAISGFYYIWLSHGTLINNQLLALSAILTLLALGSIFGSFFHLHCGTSFSRTLRDLFKLSAVSSHHLLILVGLGSLSWSGHLFHISLPTHCLLASRTSALQDFPSPHSMISLVQESSFSLLQTMHLQTHSGPISSLMLSIGLDHSFPTRYWNSLVII